MSEQLPATIQTSDTARQSVFASEHSFELAQRMAKAFASSGLVPKEYQGNTANSLIALELAHRIGASPIMVAQNLNVIHGRPSWSSTFVIAAINTCGKFAPLKFKLEGAGDQRSCTAWTHDKSGEVLEGPAVTIAMAKAEGWYDRNGSKWKTMPELMLRYRASAFFGRLYAPEILLGMRTTEEEQDLIIDVSSAPAQELVSINEKIATKKRDGIKRQASTNIDKISTAKDVGTPNETATADQPDQPEEHF